MHVVKQVFHNDRDVEFIAFAREVKNYIINTYFSLEIGFCNLRGKSCEMLAEELVDIYGLEECRVYEDGENGGIVRRSH